MKTLKELHAARPIPKRRVSRINAAVARILNPVAYARPDRDDVRRAKLNKADRDARPRPAPKPGLSRRGALACGLAATTMVAAAATAHRANAQVEEATALSAQALRAALYTPIDGADHAAQIEALLTANGVVVLDVGTTTLNRGIIPPAGTKLIARAAGGKCILKLDTAATSRYVVKMGGDKVWVDAVLVDGNLVAREAAGSLTDFVFGFDMTEVNDTLIRACGAQDCGDTDADFGSLGGNGGGFIMQMTETATADMTGNKVLDFYTPLGLAKAGFIGRMYTPIKNGGGAIGHGVLTYFLSMNEIRGARGTGCRKNNIELAGCNTQGNTVRDCVMTDPTGQGVIECDFGSSFNHIVGCKVFFSKTWTIARSIDNFSQRRSDSTGGGRTFGNVIEDCVVDFRGTLTGAFNMNGFVEAGQSSDAQFIRPKMFATGAYGSNTWPQSAYTGAICGYFAQLDLGKGHNTYVYGAEFYNVTRGFKFVGSQGSDYVLFDQCHVFSRGQIGENSSSAAYDQVVLNGGYWQTTTATLAIAGTGTTTVFDMSTARSQINATNPISLNNRTLAPPRAYAWMDRPGRRGERSFILSDHPLGILA